MRDDCITVLLGLEELAVLEQDELEDRIEVVVRYRRRGEQCPRCGSWTEKVHSTSRQRKRDRRLWDKPVFLLLDKRRFHCRVCGRVFTESDPVFGMRRRSSHRFREYLGKESQHQTVKRVAENERVGEGLVRRCLTEVSAPCVVSNEQPPEELQVIGMDEYSVKRRHVYDTTLCDLERHQVVGIVSGRGSKAVEGYLKRLPHPERVRVVVMDMHEPYRRAVRRCLALKPIVVDKFHVISQTNRALDQVRRRRQRGADPERRGELFRCRWLLLKAAERLTLEEQVQLARVLADEELCSGWALKEKLRVWYQSATPVDAEERLSAWEEAIRQHGPAEFRTLLSFCRTWRQEIVNYFTWPYTNGFVEGKNNRIKAIKRRGYGYRNRDNLRQQVFLSNRVLVASAA